MKLTWSSDKQRAIEWRFAKQYLMGETWTVSDIKKIKRGVYLDRDTGEEVMLTHSYILLSGKIFAIGDKNNYLQHNTKSNTARVKCAMDEYGVLYALKIEPVKRDGIALEISTTTDLDVAHGGGIRINKYGQQKGYCPYYYFGDHTFHDYLLQRHTIRDDDLAYSLAIKTARIVHDLHSGKKSKMHLKYGHLDLKPGNIIYDADSGEMFLIDFGFSQRLEGNATKHRGTEGYVPRHMLDYTRKTLDIFALLRIFYFPEKFQTEFKHGDEKRTVNDACIFSDSLVGKNARLRHLLFATDDNMALSSLSALTIARELTLMRCKLDDSYQELFASEYAIDLVNYLYSKKIRIKKEYVIFAQPIMERINLLSNPTRAEFDKFIVELNKIMHVEDSDVKKSHELSTMQVLVDQRSADQKEIISEKPSVKNDVPIWNVSLID